MWDSILKCCAATRNWERTAPASNTHHACLTKTRSIGSIHAEILRTSIQAAKSSHTTGDLCCLKRNHARYQDLMTRTAGTAISSQGHYADYLTEGRTSLHSGITAART